MIQVPHFPHMFVQAESVSRSARCEALLNNPRFMVDRATREACGQAVEQRPDERPEHRGHQHH
ncbi:MAG: hypothetical protein LAT50_12875 [Ectothiorhodospiraceae bacterium]|nr:hypothetical protein [Ectothiorhodospiraceae bacterium]